MSNAGIDYGLSQSNRDLFTGIRYGVISQHSLSGEALSDMEPDYGDPSCPECGGEVTDSDGEKGEDKDYWCENCHKVYWSDQVFGDEPINHVYEDGRYSLEDCLDSDVMVLRSPYYTYARFCSPCCPGAGDLDSPTIKSSGVKTYALGPEWFEDEKLPYPLYLVDNDELVG